jgi:predicted NACHT family NTPase
MSLKASAEGLKKAKEKFKTKGKSQEYLAGSVGCTRQVIGKFLQGKAITTQFFQDICDELDLTWVEIADLEVDPPQTVHDAEIDALVQEVRSKVSASIQKRCGTMRVLDMTQPITVDSIYTSVNILEKISRNQRRSVEELLDLCEIGDFDLFNLSKVQQDPIPALEAVKRHDKLMILGKPGAGKTTFLKWLALQCEEGGAQVDRVPFFITLKEFAEMQGEPDLLDFVAHQLTECGVELGTEVGARILKAGRSIVLLDGLDEVRAQDHDRVINTIRHTAEHFAKNQFVLTCRVAAKEYVFEQFTEVEVADFDDRQIADFADKWFQAKDPIKAKEFPQELKANAGLKELATNPLLLTLLCLVFEEGGRFPANRAELYKEGLDVLLKKWDSKRNIKREEVYKQLSLQRKEDLLSQVAYMTFANNDYFFKQAFVEVQIRDYIRNLPNASSDPEALQLDTEAVLNSITAHHGLLIERARHIYSFSHLTFQEFFTARWFKEKADGDLGNFLGHITEPRWREVFLLTVEMLQNADRLLQGMKQEIDGLLFQDQDLQRFLVSAEKKSFSTKNHYKPAAVRAYYLYRALYRPLDCARDLVHSLAPALANDCDLACDLVRALDLANALASALVRDLDCALPRDHALDLARALALANAHAHARDSALVRALDIESTDLKRSLQQLKDQLPDFYPDSRNSFMHWWQLNGLVWSEQLRAIKIEHHIIDHEWQFSGDQMKLLQQYYEANKLLIDCLNSDCYISREVREEIESTLLLPSV